jgi:hypothetical protein
MATLNEVFSARSVRRRYEVWFLRMALANGSGAWWFRYLLMNPGRGGCNADPAGAPVQVWATWFPKDEKPQSLIQGFPDESLDLSQRGTSPLRFRVGESRIDENSCEGLVRAGGHEVSWRLRYHSTFCVTLSDKGWIGFSRTPHSDAVFSGTITMDGRSIDGDPLAFGLQGHNCGYRHRGFWRWTHSFFPRPTGPATTLEALVYDMPLGFVFRKAVLYHEGKVHIFRGLQEESVTRDKVLWKFRCSDKTGLRLAAEIDGDGISAHRLPYLKTDCTGNFDVVNNSLASATVLIGKANRPVERLETETGAVLEMAGDYVFR